LRRPPFGRITQEVKTTSSVVYTVAYTYDAAGNITQVTYSSGRTVSYSRDSLGHVSGVTTKATSTSSPVTLASSVTFKPFGPLASLTYGNGLALTKTFTTDYLLNTLVVQDTSTSTVILNRLFIGRSLMEILGMRISSPIYFHRRNGM
jgi:YD repeat-containing protein